MFGIRPADQARAFALVLAAHGVVIWLVLVFAHTSFLRERETIVDVFDVRPAEPPRPVEPPPAPAIVAATPRGATAPVRPAARQTPPAIASIVQAPNASPSPAPEGPQAQAGGTSGGGTDGPGSGLGSTGAGVGGLAPATAPRLRSGEIVPRDYPRSAAGAQGSVVAHVAVGTDGRATGCTIVHSSGSAILDSTTCRLIRERFRFIPARNAQGEAVPGEFGWQQRWWRD